MLRTAAFLLAMTAFPAAAQDAEKPWYDPSQTMCLLTIGNAPANAPKFSDYPVKEHWQGKPAPVSMATARARRYRTMMRAEQADGPDFAGHYKVAMWGCGAPCTGWAVIDAKTGAVFTPLGYANMSENHVDDDRFYYRMDSRMIIVEGEPEEPGGEARAGITYLLFTGKGFRKLAFYPEREYCLPTYPR